MFMFSSITSVDGWSISDYVIMLIQYSSTLGNGPTQKPLVLLPGKLGPWERLSLTLTVRLGT